MDPVRLLALALVGVGAYLFGTTLAKEQESGHTSNVPSENPPASSDSTPTGDAGNPQT